MTFFLTGCRYMSVDTIKIVKSGEPVMDAYVDIIYTNSGFLLQNGKGPTNAEGVVYLESTIPINPSAYAVVKIDRGKELVVQYDNLYLENSSVLIIDIEYATQGSFLKDGISFPIK